MREAKDQISFIFFNWVFYLAVPYMNNLKQFSRKSKTNLAFNYSGYTLQKNLWILYQWFAKSCLVYGKRIKWNVKFLPDCNCRYNALWNFHIVL